MVSERMSDRPYLSIGEVLGLLLEEFPDVTISKIRFLESQGLIDPERTPSGYRKFYDGDVERLRMILREQRENFLPLKVIRDRLERATAEGEGGATPPGIRNVTVLPLGDDSRDTAVSRQHPSAQLRLAEPASDTLVAELPTAAGAAQDVDPAATSTGDHGAASAVDPATASSAGAPAEDDTAPLPAVTPSAPASGDATGAGSTTTSGVQGTAVLGTDPRQSYSAAELCSLAGISAAQLAEIEAFGLIAARGSGDFATYGGVDLSIASAAAGFLHRGVEGRHLRAWRQAAEREAGLFEQLILPQLRQRNPQARQQAVDTLRELSRLGGELRAALVAAALRHHLDP
jgi:DNA-binding transcriptional MerR regulator